MPSILDALSRAARAAYPFIRRGVREGLSSRRIASAIQDALGTSIRRQTLLDIMRAEGAAQRGASALQSLNLDKRPNPERLPFALTKLRREFSFTALVTGTSATTGRVTTTNITISTNENLTRQQMVEAASDAAEGSGPSGGVEVLEVRITGGLRKGPAGLL